MLLIPTCDYENMIQIASPQIGKEEREAVDRVLRSGIIAQGPEVAKFEEEFAKVCGVKHAIAACNGTTAGHLVMLASDIGPGDEVITTPFTFFATASVVMMAGAKPVFVDVEEDGFCLDPKKVDPLRRTASGGCCRRRADLPEPRRRAEGTAALVLRLQPVTMLPNS